ncbi:TPA: hypothetical protein UN036_000012 [Stenotrophomonas maltophilia]|uniref:hypothetical protein n=1 Tax=Stenotrophomonas maltophilia TaxID=40324 RepID=UPI000C14D378|nr:hypothetical protein [Stenotrophomonas maltophilia]HEL4660736.1 hypothetical protein [Stenotrophomonas maltophilia]
MEPSQIPRYAERDPTLQGWVIRNGRWELWWSGRDVAIVQPDRDGAAVILDCRRFFQEKHVRAASAEQGKRFAERWCAARLMPELRLREAVARLTAKPKPTRLERQQAERLAAIRPPKIG